VTLQIFKFAAIFEADHRFWEARGTAGAIPSLIPARGAIGNRPGLVAEVLPAGPPGCRHDPASPSSLDERAGPLDTVVFAQIGTPSAIA
jgi:hypothetical protein